MKKLLSTLLLVFMLAAPFSTFAASGETKNKGSNSGDVGGRSSKEVDHFEVTVEPQNAKVGEAVDVTVKAVDKEGNVAKGYGGTIFISVDNDSKATIPYADGYTYTDADLGQKTFSKGLSFTKEGKMKVMVLDMDNQQLDGEVEVNVGAGSGSGDTPAGGDITITSPDDGMTITEDTVTVSGTAKKNSKVKFYLNGAELKDLETQSDEKGGFLAEITGISQTQNVIQVRVYDGNNSQIAESKKINLSYEGSGPSIKSFKLEEGTELPAGSQATAVLVSEPGLSEVTAGIGDAVQTLVESEESPGTYTGSLTLPNTPGEYQIDLNLKNALGKSTNKKAAASVNVIQSNIFSNIKVEIGDKKATITFSVNPDKAEYVKFKFIYGTSQDTLKTEGDTQNKESITFEKEKIKQADGNYKWYIPGLEQGSKYYAKIFPVGVDGLNVAGLESSVFEMDLSMSAPPGRCTINNVSGMKSSKNGDVVELSWDSLPEATSYNIYKKKSDGTIVLVENVPTNKYTINITGNKVAYEDFMVKGICGQGESKAESQDYSNATRVQTGPAQLALIVCISLIGGYFLMRRRVSK